LTRSTIGSIPFGGDSLANLVPNAEIGPKDFFEIASRNIFNLNLNKEHSMKLTDLQPMEKWIELEKKILDKYQIQSATLNTEGIRITDFVKWTNRICPVVKLHEKGGPFICAVAHKNMAAQARRTSKPVVAECDAGILKTVVPIFIKDEFVGTTGGCGRLAADGEVDTFMISKTIGMDETAVEGLAGDIGSMTTEQAQECAAFVESEVKRIVAEFEAGQK
jgi:ligand-binding sensor protein